MSIFRIVHWTELPFEHESKRLMDDELFREYVTDNGWHFTDQLADYATKQMENADGAKHNWTTKEVREAFKANAMEKGSNSTWGDVAYTANMARADFYPALLKTDADCLKYAKMVSDDPDGYDGMEFMRWVSDYIGKKMDVDWDVYV